MERSKMLNAIDESIEHWKRMISWVESLDSGELKCEHAYDQMFSAIGENWHGDDCALCVLLSDCTICPVRMFHERCGVRRSAWRKVADSKTWAGWLRQAKRMLKLLLDVRSKYVSAVAGICPHCGGEL